MNTNSMYCADAKNCSCEMCNECCGNVNVSGCGNPMYNVFSWNSPRKCCYRPELCAIDILHYYLTKGEAAELYVNNREFLDFLNEIKNVYETKEHVLEILQDLLDKIDSVAESYEWDDIKNKPSFATVATSGDYGDLNNKPKFKTFNGESILGDGDVADNLAKVAKTGDYNDLKSKPTIPTKTSDLINDSDFVNGTELQEVSEGKQDRLVSGENIKTINNESLLGEGNIDISGTGDKPYDPESYSGLGKKILKLKDGSNTLTQEDFDQENTIYIISYDFELGNETVKVPEGCVLDFEGGSINNGKLVSNRTKLLGDWGRTNSLWGVYYNNGEALTYNYTYKKPMLLNMDHGYNPKAQDTSARNISQSIVVTSENVFVLVEKDNVDAGIDVFDRNFNKIKSVSLSASSHANDATLMGDSILIAGCRDTIQGIQKVEIDDIIEAEDGDEVSVTLLPILTESTIIALDYDKNREELAVWYDEGVSIYDDSLSLIKRINNLYSAAIELVGKNITQQGMVYKNGIVSQYFWNHVLNRENPAGCIVIDIDVATGSLLIRDNLPLPYADAEIEGVCKDPKNEGIVWGTVYIRNNVDTYIGIFRCSNIETIAGNQLDKNDGNGFLSDSAYIPIYVDSAYTGVSDGGETRPYKSLDTALCLSAFIKSGRYRIYLRTGTYYVGNLRIANCLVTLHNASGKVDGQNAVKVCGSFYLNQGEVNFLDLDVILTNPTPVVSGSRSGIYAAENSYVAIRNGVVKGNDTTVQTISGLAIQNSDLQINDVSFSNLHYCIALENAIVRRFKNIKVNDCISLFALLTKSEILSNHVLSNITFTQSTTRLFYSQTVEEFIKEIIAAENFFSVEDMLIERASQSTFGFGTTFAVCVLVQNYALVNNKRISRGMYYWNGTNLVKYGGAYNPYDSRIDSSGTFPTFPAVLPTVLPTGTVLTEGTRFYDVATNKSYYYENDRYYEYDGLKAYANRKGATADRPITSDGIYIGFTYFDTTLGKPIYWNGTNWVDATGAVV